MTPQKVDMNENSFNDLIDDLMSYSTREEREKILKDGLKRAFFMKGGLAHGFSYYDGFKNVIDNANLKENDKVLVIGSSIGTIPFYLKQYLNTNPIGVEYVKYRHDFALEMCEKYNIKDIEFINGDIIDYEYPNDLKFVWIDNMVFPQNLTEKLYNDMFENGFNFLCYREPENIPDNYTMVNIIDKEGWKIKADHYILTKNG
jgi:hypothetical protein